VTTAVDAVAQALRAQILTGSPAPGERLREEALAERFEVARHTVRAALRALAAEHLVVVAPHRGARVARLEGEELQALFDLRAALEVEAAHLFVQRAGWGPGADGEWPDAVRAAAAELERRCATPGTADRVAVDEAHLGLHQALVAAAGSPRITAAHAALADEQRLVLLQSRPVLDPALMAAHHRALLTDLRRSGPEALRRHLTEGHGFSRALVMNGAGQAPQ
jgi:DNA-binding GntR family transcriptional regulator